MAPRNEFYSSTINELYRGKDSIFEMAKILNYDREKQIARVYTLTSMQYRDEVPVLFPSIYSNSGIISPPVVRSTGMLLWGADRQAYLLPVQYNPPVITVKDGVRQINASPSTEDETLTLKNIQEGEHLIRSLGKSYIFIKNLGDIELGTPSLYRLSLTERDGAFDLNSERIKQEIGNNRFYFGPASRDSNADKRTHWYFSMSEISDRTKRIPENISDEELLNKILSGNTAEIEVVETPKIFTQQKGHVLDEVGVAEVDPVDGTELFSKEVYEKDDAMRTETISKAGRKVIETKGDGVETEIVTSKSEVKVTQRRIEGSLINSTSIGINEAGEIYVEKDGKNFDLWPLLEWFYEQRTV